MSPPAGGESDDDDLPFLRGPLPERFRRLHVLLEPGVPRTYVAAEWRDALVVVEQGRLDLECHLGGVRTFPEGAVLHLDGLALRALRCDGPDPTVLTAVLRRNTVEPRIVDLPDRPYLGVRAVCTATTMNVVADRLPGIIGHVLGRGGALAGAPFIRYHRVGPGDEYDAEAGVPVDDPGPATDGPATHDPATDDIVTEGPAHDITAGTLPAGRYAVTRHTGHLDGLPAATDALLAWAGDRDLAWDRTDTPHGERWGARVEHFLTNPAEEPDPSRYVTELSFRLADA